MDVGLTRRCQGVALIAMGVASIAFSACGNDGSRDTSGERVEIVGTSAQDERIANDFYRYLQRGCGSKRVKPCGNFERIEARNGVLTITTDLGPSAADRQLAREICDVIQGSDVADFTEGHSVNGPNSLRLATCPRRTQ